MKTKHVPLQRQTAFEKYATTGGNLIALQVLAKNYGLENFISSSGFKRLTLRTKDAEVVFEVGAKPTGFASGKLEVATHEQLGKTLQWLKAGGYFHRNWGYQTPLLSAPYTFILYESGAWE